MKYRMRTGFIGIVIVLTVVAAVLAAGSPARVSAEGADPASSVPPVKGVASATWDSCSQITWKIRRPGVPRQTAAKVRMAIGELSKATGLRIVYGGHASRAEMARPADGTIVVGFSSALAKKNYGGVTKLKKVGVGDSGALRIVSAQVVINKSLLSGSQRGLFMPVLLHELGHAVGLTHVADSTDIMYPIAVEGAAYRGAVLAKLAAVGSAGVCPRN